MRELAGEKKKNEFDEVPWLARTLRSLEIYQERSQSATGEEWGELHDRMAKLLNVVYGKDKKFEAVFLSALGRAEEGTFDAKQAFSNFSPDLIREMNQFFDAEESKGEIRLNELLIARIDGPVMEIHLPPARTDISPRQLYNGFIQGMQVAVKEAKARGVSTIEMTSWLLGRTHPDKLKGLGELTEEGISDETKQEAQYGGMMFNTKSLEEYLNYGTLPIVKRMEFTPDHLEQYLQQVTGS